MLATPAPESTAADGASTKRNSTSFHLQNMTDAELQEVFSQFDTDGDGKISASELSQVLSAMGFVTSPDDIQRAMEEIDTDCDGFIDLAEFAALCLSNSSSSSDLRDAFDLYDQDRNGLISSEELHLVLNRLNMSCSVNDCVRMIKSVDSDGDGNVNFAEFEKMMTTGSVANGSAISINKRLSRSGRTRGLNLMM